MALPQGLLARCACLLAPCACRLSVGPFVQESVLSQIGVGSWAQTSILHFFVGGAEEAAIRGQVG